MSTFRRLRFAPSPTGFLHLGGLRTALFNYLLAKQSADGKFILRIEDTDRSRTVPGAMEGIMDALKWAGIRADEGPGDPGPDGFGYIQSGRLEVYQKRIAELIDRGHAYRCYCPKAPEHSGPSRYPKTCRNISHQQQLRHSGDPFVIRFKAPEGNNTNPINDLVYGQVLIPDAIEDVVLIKSDGVPTYHFANVVDDCAMGIDLVMRGQEWLPSTPLHLALYKALDMQHPSFAHLPLLLNPDGSKLSKRQSSSHVSSYRDSGIYPSALLNFVALLGWTPKGKREILDLPDMISEFNVHDLNKSDAVVDLERLNWFNRQHMASIIPKDTLVMDLTAVAGKKHGQTYLSKILTLMSTRFNTLTELVRDNEYFFHEPPMIDIEQDRLTYLSTLHFIVSEQPEFDRESIKRAIDAAHCLDSDRAIRQKNIMAARLAVTGKRVGASLTGTFEVLGREAVLRRLSNYAHFPKCA